jgi:hypothetical protein
MLTTQVAKPVDISKAAQLLEESQGLTPLALFTTLLEDQQQHKELLTQYQWSICEQLE